MAGYFKVPLAAARAIADATETPDLLAAYLVLRRHAFGNQRNVTAAGAKSIRLAAGMTDFRSKRLMDELRGLRFGDRGELALIEPTGRHKGNAPLYKLPKWDGPDAYLPALLLDVHPQHGSALAQLCHGNGVPEVQRDALHLLLHLYACTDYGGWMGAPPDLFAYQAWDTSGWRTREGDYDLGHCGRDGPLDVWLVAPPIDDTWLMPVAICKAVFGDASEASKQRFWPALWYLHNSGAVCKVAVVADGRETYPLWVFSPAYRTALGELGIEAGLATGVHRLAREAGFDPDNMLIREAVAEDREIDGTGLFFCIGKAPVVRTLMAPRLHAPTPVNMDGLQEVARKTAALQRRLDARRGIDRWAA